ncbi:MAG: hypothetical protein DWQ44_09655 [Bacteroidetes bacterium]|nr:MAG: hypothetical protein DWQ33_09930 [Bacteroidota bacterium]REK06548.1 MAG: hypothetical protein DWQ39_03445 [Bacteroidota bacterium]REK33314.1 MAG: hypothetical protein DWQ44_09655 [Bacteroidota bacterium]REK49714.1 MAG: hypothetical protein DWQ48_06210 [Bacteroidota bacterium]
MRSEYYSLLILTAARILINSRVKKIFVLLDAPGNSQNIDFRIHGSISFPEYWKISHKSRKI